MLLMAQRVVSPATRTQGVNVYRFSHGPYEWSRVPDEVLPDENPGELVEQWIVLPDGGNTVVSYLDIVCPDYVDAIDLHQRLISLRYQLRPANDVGVYWDPYWVRFGTSVTRMPLQTELGALAGNILLCLAGRR